MPNPSPFAVALAAAVEESRPRPYCSVGALLVTLDDDLAGEVRSSLALPASDLSHAALSVALGKAFGVKVAGQTVSRHRRHACGCQA